MRREPARCVPAVEIDLAVVSFAGVPLSRRALERPERNSAQALIESGIGTLRWALVAAASTGLSLRRSG